MRIDMLAPALAPLGTYPQFVAWRIDMRRNAEGVEVPTKVPYSPVTGWGADPTNPAHWTTYDVALAFAKARGMVGVGFVFTPTDPFFFLDVDKCLINGAWSMLAQELCARFPGAMVEVSYSGTGLHIVGSCTKGFDHKSRNTPLKLELYTEGRFMALGTQATGSVLTPMDTPLASVVAQFFTRDINAAMATEWTTEPRSDWRGPDDDGELLMRALRPKGGAAAAFGGETGEPSFEDLFTANADVLGAKWPDPVQGRGFDYTNAEMSLANMLAFWTGANCERMERIMRMSALVRPKWDTHASYLQNTILKAAGFVQKVYVERAAAAATGPTPEETQEAARLVEEGRKLPKDYLGVFASYDVMSALFGGYVFIQGVNRIMTRDGKLLDKTGFDQEHNGPNYSPFSDGKKLVSSAWDAQRDSQHFRLPLAHGMCFRPERADERLIEDGNRTLVNMYRAPRLNLVAGDPSKFLNHMRRMLPNGDDLEILLSYFARCAQNPGVKVQWWPVIVGAKGSFKSTWTEIMKRAVGSEYVHDVNSKQLVEGSSNFNGWIENKLFLGIDDVHGGGRREFLDSFKPTITNRSIPIEGKGREQVTGDNRANGVMTANEKDGIPISQGERRYAPFFYSCQTVPELRAAGMDPAYLGDIHDWLAGVGAHAGLGRDYGFNVMANYLHTREIHAAFNEVAAPNTSATKSAIAAGLGRGEQEIVEAIEEGRPGFCGDWVSSYYLNALLEKTRAHIHRNKRRDVMVVLGYDWHPALVDGRVHNVVAPDNSKPKLYCKIGSISWNNLTEPAAVAAAYTKAQGLQGAQAAFG